jgi:putative membrane protein
MPFHSGYGYYGTGDWLWSIFSTALFIVLVTMAIMLLVRLFSGQRRPGPGTSARPLWAPQTPTTPQAQAEGAERILAERYARGEISEEEYRGRLDVLRQTGHATGWTQPQPSQPPPPPQPQPPQQSQQRTEEVV